jgi:hypothetical protein
MKAKSESLAQLQQSSAVKFRKHIETQEYKCQQGAIFAIRIDSTKPYLVAAWPWLDFGGNRKGNSIATALRPCQVARAAQRVRVQEACGQARFQIALPAVPMPAGPVWHQRWQHPGSPHSCSMRRSAAPTVAAAAHRPARLRRRLLLRRRSGRTAARRRRRRTAPARRSAAGGTPPAAPHPHP